MAARRSTRGPRAAAGGAARRRTAARRRRWVRAPAYALVSMVLIAVTALTASADMRAAAARWALDVTAPAAGPGTETGNADNAPEEAQAAERAQEARRRVEQGLAPDDPARRDPGRDAQACDRIAQAAQRHRADELTLHGYTAELRRAADRAAPGGNVRRHTRALLDAIGAHDTRAEQRARDGLVDACALAAALTAG